MSNQNRFLLHHQSATSSAAVKLGVGSSSLSPLSTSNQENENQLSVDDNFDSYWEEEARNPHRNRIRIGRQYQATVPQLLKPGEKDPRKLVQLETLSFCPKKSAKVSDAELDHYFTVAKSLNLFASLVETRSLLGRDVTIADLNRIRHKEGLSLASVIQPSRHSSNNYNSNIYPQSSQQQNSASSSNVDQRSPNKSPQNSTDNLTGSLSSTEAPTNSQSSIAQENFAPNPPLMKALSHFISLHHPCHHDSDCKKLLKDSPLDDQSEPTVSIKAGNLREKGLSASQNSVKETKASRSRLTVKQLSASSSKSDDSEAKDFISNEQEQSTSDTYNQPGPTQDWTREEVAMFSKAIEVCGKNFGSIKKEFLPSKSVRSIVEYYYIGSRDASESKRKSSHNLDASDGSCGPEKSQANNGSDDGGNGCDQISPTSRGAPNMNVTAIRGTGPNGKSENGSNKSSTNVSVDSSKQAHNNKNLDNKLSSSARQTKVDDANNKSKVKNIDARMSVYNFDDEIKDDSSPVPDCPCPGAEVKPLKAKPILPNTASGSEAGNSNVGSLKFFMDGQLVLKLNACQEQQKCHWVQSGDKIPTTNQRQKRYSKRTNDRLNDLSSQNGSHSNSTNDDDLKADDLTAEDEDSKESGNSFSNVVTPRQASFSVSPSPKRSKVRTDANQPLVQPAQMSSPIDYNRLAVTNMKERNDNTMNSNMNNNMDTSNILTNPMMNPWLQQANSLAMNLFSLFPQAANNLVAGGQVPPPMPNLMNMAPRPMDLSVEHSHSQKPIQSNPKPASRSKSKQRNN